MNINKIYLSCANVDLNTIKKHILDKCLDRAIILDDMIMVEKLKNYLLYTDLDMCKRGILLKAPVVLEKYLKSSGLKSVELGYFEFNQRSKKVVKLLLHNNIEITDVLVVELLKFDDIVICKYLINMFPTFTLLNKNGRHSLGNGFRSTSNFLVFAIIAACLNCFPTILNSCQHVDDLSIEHGKIIFPPRLNVVNISNHYKKAFEKYKFTCKDLQLLEFTKHYNHGPASDKLFDYILYFYTIRENWYQIIGQRVSRIQGFCRTNKLLDNNLIPFLIWISMQKPKGLPRRLIQYCIYPYIF